MASSMIHIAIASELNKKLNRDKSKLFIGTISPDISKLIGQDKKITHFLTKEGSELPDLDYFLSESGKELYGIRIFTHGTAAGNRSYATAGKSESSCIRSGRCRRICRRSTGKKRHRSTGPH